MRAITTVALLLVFPVQPAAAQDVRDSANIQIVENRGGSWSADEAWTVANAPDLSIGRVEAGPPQYLFSDIKTVEFLSDGRLAVADRGSAQIRFYTSDGDFDGAVGGPGDGPGDFRWLGWIGQCREGLIEAYDPLLGRVTTIRVNDLTVAGTRSIRSSVGQRPPTVVRCSEGGVVGVTRGLGAPPAIPGAVRWPVTIEFYSTTGVVHVVAETRGDDRYFDGGQIGPLSLGRRFVIASDGEFLATGTQDTPEIAIRSVTGEFRRIVRWSDSTLRVTEADKEATIERFVASASSAEQSARFRSYFRGYPFPETHPAFGDLLFDERGYLWVESSHRLTEMDNDWRIFSPSGEFLGMVSFPDGFRPMTFGGSRVAGVWRDELSVEFVWVLEITR